MSGWQPRQGNLDMLCGIYCAARIIACYTVAHRANPKNQASIFEKAAKNAFRNLVVSAENEGLLTAKKIASENGGYYDHELVEIFNGMTLRRRLNLSAVSFRDPMIKRLKNSERRDLIVSFGSCAIVQEDGDRHWIMVEGLHREGGYSCYDPEGVVEQRKRLSWSRGLFVLKPEVLGLVHAQTH